jgi:hypothetical protein
LNRHEAPAEWLNFLWRGGIEPMQNHLADSTRPDQRVAQLPRLRDSRFEIEIFPGRKTFEDVLLKPEAQGCWLAQLPLLEALLTA